MRFPATLYMYCPPKAVALLWDRRFKATSPDQLNDPFEFDPPFTGRTSREFLGKHFPQANVEELHQRQENVRASARERFRAIREDYKVICFSADPTDVLSWALYADKHRGFVVGIDSSVIRPSNQEKVRYSKKRPSINIKTALVASSAKMAEHWRRAFRTKSLEWKHEREFRWIFRTRYAKRGADNNGNEVYYLPFKPVWIKEVILGARCSIDDAIRNAHVADA